MELFSPNKEGNPIMCDKILKNIILSEIFQTNTV